jgi:hypothetical protein
MKTDNRAAHLLPQHLLIRGPNGPVNPANDWDYSTNGKDIMTTEDCALGSKPMRLPMVILLPRGNPNGHHPRRQRDW